MVMRPDVIGRAIENLQDSVPDSHDIAFVYPGTEAGYWIVKMARQLSQKDGMVIVCGRYEGLDQRAIEHYQLEEVSIGTDGKASGGEQAAMVGTGCGCPAIARCDGQRDQPFGR